jgi:hypothetical protein
VNTFKKAAISGSIVAASLVGGFVGAQSIGTAGAQSNTSATTATTAPSTSSGSTAPQGQAPQGQAPQGQPPQGNVDPTKGGHQANGITEELLTGDTAAKVTAAAKKAVPDGTIQRVETDAEGDAYEAHVQKADGSLVTLKFDKDFKLTATEDGPSGPPQGAPTGPNGAPAPNGQDGQNGQNGTTAGN